MRGTGSKGFTLLELLIVIALIGIVGAIAIPLLIRARISGNEASAVASVRTITSSQYDFYGMSRGFADDLARLAARCPGSSAGFISADLATNGVTKSGYRFSVVAGAGGAPGPNDCFGLPTQTTYYATAVPITVGISGDRGFAVDTHNGIWENTAGTAPTQPFTTTATVSPFGQ